MPTPQPQGVILSATRQSWAASVQHGSAFDASKRMRKVRDRVLNRDDHTCQSCGWRAMQFQEISHRDGDHDNFELSNLETLCPLCHQVLHPDLAALTSGGSIIWLPEMTQTELNRLLFPLFVVLAAGPSHPWHAAAKAVSGILDMRKLFMENQIGKSDPALFGQILLNLSPADYQARHELMGSMKMMAHPSRFEAEVEHWRTVLEQHRSMDQWLVWAQALETPQ